MIFGGVPFYLSLLNTADSLAQNIDRLFFSEGAQLKMEFDELYNALFTNADTYISVVRLLSENKSGMTRKDMAAKSATTVSGLRISTRCSITSSLNPTTPKMTDGGATTWILVVCPHGWG